MTDLSGFWIGRYSYGQISEAPVPFEAEFTHTGVSLSGIITEPNTFQDDGGELLNATIAGSVIGPSVSFAKTYQCGPGADHTVHYEGRIDPKGARITGRWNNDGLSGPFEMERDGPAVAVEYVEVKAGVDNEAETALETEDEDVER